VRVGGRGWCRHQSIGAGIMAAGEGSVVSVAPGDYQESVLVDRPVTVVCERGPGTVRVISPYGPALTVSAAAATVRGLHLVAGAGTGPAVRITAGTTTLDGCWPQAGTSRSPGRPRPNCGTARSARQGRPD
jgi:nitrous oxidase accessory protein NosD